MKKVQSTLDLNQLLEIDPNLELTKIEIIKWLEKYKPYTNNILNEIKINGFSNVPSLIQEFLKYVRELTYKDINTLEEVDNRIKAVLELVHDFYNEHRSEFISVYEKSYQIKFKAHENMMRISSKAQLINNTPRNSVSKNDIIMIHMEILKDSIEGVLNRLISFIIFILEYNENLTADIEDIDKRYFSEKYYSYSKYKNIENDFPLLFLDINKALRNANAHFDYEINPKTEIIRCKSKYENIEVTYSELRKEINKASCIAKQIAIAYELFEYETLNELCVTSDSSNFEMEIAALSQVFLHSNLVIQNYSYQESKLVLYIDNSSDMNLFNLYMFLLRHAINYLRLVEIYEEEVIQIILNINNSIDIKIDIGLLNELDNNITEETFMIFIDKVLDLNGYTKD